MNRVFVPIAMAALSCAANGADQPADHRLKLEFDELSAKATAGIGTVNFMERRANEDGLSLHPNLIAQRALVQSSMDDAQEALRANDMDALRTRLDRARGIIDRLYRMF